MFTSSRYVRREQPARGLVVQPRDRAILETVGHYGFVSSEHLHQLLFPAVSLRVTQVRLRALWEHGFLERSFLPVVLTTTPWNVPGPTRPFYSLGRAGLELLADGNADVVRGLRGPTLQAATLQHDLVVTDFLVALTVACRSRSDVVLESTEPESSLRRKLSTRRPELPRSGIGYVLPDGAFTLQSAPDQRNLTFYLEIVRADVKGGNLRLIAKLERYLKLLRAGFFRAAYGHDHVRAVLVVTTSPARATNIHTLAAALPHGHRLFWFGSWGRGDPGEPSLPALDASTILNQSWITAAGDEVTLLQAATLSAFAH